MSADRTTGALGMDLEYALRGLWEASITVERTAWETAAGEASDARREAMICLAATLHEAIGQLAALATVG